MEDTGHYHFALLRYLLSKGFAVALINPVATDMTRKMQGGISKNDKLDTFVFLQQEMQSLQTLWRLL